MSIVHSFDPLVGPNPHVLILGSMPGVASLRASQYYAHPRNAFWPIMNRLFGIPSTDPYSVRASALTASGVAVWDVLELCTRDGSLDSAIVTTSVVANDIGAFVLDYESIEHILFNGGAAEQIFHRHVTLPRAIACTRLPSTSPAHAALSLDAKTEAWRAAM
ncbi:MAG: DNA-deoxyinosine glycosylase [Rhodococcus sp. (in: high G+C Gram-positive bacteria)]